MSSPLFPRSSLLDRPSSSSSSLHHEFVPSHLPPDSSPYHPEPSRHSGLSSSSSASSTSATSQSTRSGGTYVMVQCEESTQQPYQQASIAALQSTSYPSSSNSPSLNGLQLPEELLLHTFSFLDAHQLLQAAQVNTQWNELHDSDEFWHPLYGRWFGDSMRMDEAKGWKYNFRARDIMLSKLPHSISLLSHHDRQCRVEAVNFLRTNCEFLRFLLPIEHHGVIATTMTPISHTVHHPQMATTNGPAPPVPIMVPTQLFAGPMAVQTPPQSTVHSNGAAPAVGVTAPPLLPIHQPFVPLVPLDGSLPSIPVPLPPLLYTSTVAPPPPPVFSSHGSRPPLPGVATLELRHAQNLIKDALCNRGWRCLFEQMDPSPPPPTSDSSDRNQSSASPTSFGTESRPPSSSLSKTITRATSLLPFFPHVMSGETCKDDNDEDERPTASFYTPNIPYPSSSPASIPPSAPSRSPLPHSARMLEYGAVLVSWTEYPWLRFDTVSAELDAIAAMVERRMADVLEERYQESGIRSNQLPFIDRLQALHYILYSVLGFKGNESNYYDVRNSFIHFVLTHRTGIPITLAIVYMAVAVRLGIHCDGVNSPGHFLLRVENKIEASIASSSIEVDNMNSTDVNSMTTSSVSRRPSRVDTPMTDVSATDNSTVDASSSLSSSSHTTSEIYFVDAFSGHLMTPEVTREFLSLFTRDMGPSRQAVETQLQVCSHAALFVRMYRNLMNLYQDPAYHRQRTPTLPNMEPQAEAYSHYEMVQTQ